MNQENMDLIYTAHSKHLFYFTRHISKFVLEQGVVPLNPFMIWDYFLSDTVDRDLVREGNNNLVRRADGIWIFGPVSDGVLNEIRIARETWKPIKFFEVVKSREIREIQPYQAVFEDGLERFRGELYSNLKNGND